MIQVNSYIRQEGNFVPIALFSGVLEDPNYIEGAVELAINDRRLLTTDMWDYVDQLWSYLVDGLRAVSEGDEEYATYFPDQPIRVVFRRVQGDVVVEVTCGDTRTATAECGDFMRGMAAGARDFIENLARILPASRQNYAALLTSLAAVENAPNSGRRGSYR